MFMEPSTRAKSNPRVLLAKRSLDVSIAHIAMHCSNLQAPRFHSLKCHVVERFFCLTSGPSIGRTLVYQTEPWQLVSEKVKIAKTYNNNPTAIILSKTWIWYTQHGLDAYLLWFYPLTWTILDPHLPMQRLPTPRNPRLLREKF